jgi:putative OPT family oligopeptide transporter
LRSVITGLGVAIVIGGSYPYIVLKLGFGPNVSVVAAFFGYLALGMTTRNFNRWENNMVQTAGTTAGQTAFMCTLMAAFDILSGEPGLGFKLSLAPWQTFLWLTTAGTLGVLLAVPMRQHFVVDEKLPYPDGIAAGETLIVLDSKGPQARQVATAMVSGLVLSAATMVASFFKWIPEFWPIMVNTFSGATGVGVAWSWLSLGSGMIIGFRICANMLVGLLISWVMVPVLLFNHGVIGAGAKKTEILLWVMWPATGLMVAGGLTALFLKWRILARTFQNLSAGNVASNDFPIRWVITGSIFCTIALAALQYFSFGQSVWLTLLAVALSLPLMLVSLRVMGETNWGPISVLSNLMQGVFGLIAPGNIPANMVASGVTGSIVAESEGLMQDYKTGHMIGSTPRYLTWMQLLALPVGAAAVSFAYPLFRSTYGIGGEHGLSSPISQKWVGFAKLLSKGVEALPSGAIPALIGGIVLGILFTILEQKRSWKPFVPSPTGIGIGMLVPASAIATMFLGGLGAVIWQKVDQPRCEKYLVPLASGFISGEALMAVIIPILIAVGIL